MMKVTQDSPALQQYYRMWLLIDICFSSPACAEGSLHLFRVLNTCVPVHLHAAPSSSMLGTVCGHKMLQRTSSKCPSEMHLSQGVMISPSLHQKSSATCRVYLAQPLPLPQPAGSFICPSCLFWHGCLTILLIWLLFKSGDGLHARKEYGWHTAKGASSCMQACKLMTRLTVHARH